MKTLLAIVLIIASTGVSAQITCKYNWNNVYVCTGDNGYESQTRRNWNGADDTTDNRGNSWSCKRDWQGNYVCD